MYGNIYRHNATMELGRELLALNNTIESQQYYIDKLELKAAIYKAYFFGKTDLAGRLDKQIDANIFSQLTGIGYGTLEDMYLQGLITKEEYEFCKVV